MQKRISVEKNSRSLLRAVWVVQGGDTEERNEAGSKAAKRLSDALRHCTF